MAESPTFDIENFAETEDTEVSEQVAEFTVEELLISCVQARPPLWDSRLPLKDRAKNVRDGLWLEVFREFGENPQFSIEFLQKTWRNLSDTFVRMKNEYTPSGSAAKKKKKWEYYDSLSFQSDTMNYRPTVSNIPPPPSPTTSSCESPLVSPSLPTPKIKNKNYNESVVEGAILEALGRVNQPTPVQLLSSNEVNPICRRISDIMLDVMPTKERTLLEIKLLQWAYEGSKGYLT